MTKPFNIGYLPECRCRQVPYDDRSTNLFFPHLDNIGSISSWQCWVEALAGCVWSVVWTAEIMVHVIFLTEEGSSRRRKSIVRSSHSDRLSRQQKCLQNTTHWHWIIRLIHHDDRHQYRIHEQSFIMVESLVISKRILNHIRILPHHQHRFHYHAWHTSEQFI